MYNGPLTTRGATAMKGTCSPSRQGESVLQKGCTTSQPKSVIAHLKNWLPLIVVLGIKILN